MISVCVIQFISSQRKSWKSRGTDICAAYRWNYRLPPSHDIFQGSPVPAEHRLSYPNPLCFSLSRFIMWWPSVLILSKWILWGQLIMFRELNLKDFWPNDNSHVCWHLLNQMMLADAVLVAVTWWTSILAAFPPVFLSSVKQMLSCLFD